MITVKANNTAGGPYTVTASTASGSVTTAPGGFSLTNKPATVQVTVGTKPSGLSFSVDGKTYTSAQMLTWIIGSQHTIGTTTPQTMRGTPGTLYIFPIWSDGGANSHIVTASLSATTYTATFNVYYELTMAVSPSGSGIATPALGGYLLAGTAVDVEAFPKSGYKFKSWTGNVASATKASTTITMTAPETIRANFTKK